MIVSEDGRTAIRQFNAAAILSLLASLAAHGAQLTIGLGTFGLFACNASIIIILALTAIRAHRASDGDFDSAVGAETIVAFGVLALILGLATAIYPVLTLSGTLRFDSATLVKLGAPFVQGLAAAGLAPVIAVLVRNFSAEHGRVESTDEERRLLAVAVGRLTGELGRAKASAAELTTALAHAKGATEQLGPALAQQLGDVADATGRIAPALTASAGSLAGALDQGGRRFADDLNDAGARFAAQLDAAAAGVDALGTRAQAGAGQLGAVAGELGRVRSGAKETAELLDALGDLIASAQRFVDARQATP